MPQSIELFIINFAATALGTLAFWLGMRCYRNYRPSIKVEMIEELGPTSWEFGFTQNALKVTIRNASRVDVEIEGICLMFSRGWGFPFSPDAPPPRHHPLFPVIIRSGSQENWYFPAEQLCNSLNHIALAADQRTYVKVWPRVFTATGRVYKGRKFKFSLDMRSH